MNQLVEVANLETLIIDHLRFQFISIFPNLHYPKRNRQLAD
jgi:hypothetical protein